jgi:hypothetical protein
MNHFRYKIHHQGEIMKNLRCFIVLLVLFGMIFSLNGCVSTPIKTITEYAENIDFDPVPPDTVEDFGKLCYILAKEDGHILAVDGIDRKDVWMFVKPGVHLFTVQYSTRSTSQHRYMDPQGRWRTETITRESKSDPISLPFFIFEEGTYYYLDYEIEKGATIFSDRTIQFSITELKDPDLLAEGQKRLTEYEDAYKAAVKKYQTSIETRNAFLVFSEANPNYLEGIWNGTFTPMKPVQLTFTGNRIKFYRNYSIGPDLLMEGRFYFNEETIVVFFDKKPVTEKAKQVWYYKLTGNTLNIINAPLSGGLDSIKGQYQKSN